MKKILFAAVFCAAVTPVWSGNDYLDAAQERAYNYFHGNDEEKTFSEPLMPFPPVPDSKQGNWSDLYVSETFAGKPQLLLDSVKYAPDGSVRYILNNRSSAGYDNISAEGLQCLTGEQLLGSDGAKVKIFGFADTTRQRWIEPRNSDWKIMGGKNNAVDQVHRVLYELVCIDGKASSDEALRQRIVKQGGRHIGINYHDN